MQQNNHRPVVVAGLTIRSSRLNSPHQTSTILRQVFHYQGPNAVRTRTAPFRPFMKSARLSLVALLGSRSVPIGALLEATILRPQAKLLEAIPFPTSTVRRAHSWD